MIQSNGETTLQKQFCIGDMLVFTCTLAASGYDWVVPTFLNGAVNNGRVLLGTTETIRGFTLSASGIEPRRRSLLKVTAFPGLNGVNILCRESGYPDVNQIAAITVLGEIFAVLEVLVHVFHHLVLFITHSFEIIIL